MTNDTKRWPVRGVMRSPVEAEKLLEKMIRDQTDLAAKQASESDTYSSDITTINNDITVIEGDITTLKARKGVLLALGGRGLTALTPAPVYGELFDFVGSGTGVTMYTTHLYIPSDTTGLALKLKLTTLVNTDSIDVSCGGKSTGPQTISSVLTNQWTSEYTISAPSTGWQDLIVYMTCPSGTGHIYGIVVRAT